MGKHNASELRARTPQDFAPVLMTDKPLFIVGGQAVNLWALYYPERTVDYRPFASRDMDVLGDRETLFRIARLAGVEPQFFPARPLTNEVGVVVAKSADGHPMPVEVLTFVHGIGNRELHESEYTMAIGDNRTLVRLPGPIALLQAKIANSAQLPQEGRQDEKHVCILAQLMPGYLNDLQKSVKTKRTSERKMLKLLEKLVSVISSEKASKVLSKLQLDRLSMFAELRADSPSKLNAFLTKRLPRIFPTAD